MNATTPMKQILTLLADEWVRLRLIAVWHRSDYSNEQV
jgi:hypothetical protein